MTPVDLPEDLERLAELARADVAARAHAGNRERERMRFLARVDTEPERRGRSGSRLAWLVPAVAAACAVAVWWGLSQSLTFELEGAPRDGAYVRAPVDRPVTVKFSDRTTLVAKPDARLRVEEAGFHDARVVVERGRADVHVVHDVARDWRFVAGPFEVLVTGTRFSLDWDPVAETFELLLTEGALEIRGPTGSGPIALRAGQRFQGDARRQRMLVSEASDRAPELEPQPLPERAAQSAPLGEPTRPDPGAPAVTGAPAAPRPPVASARPAPDKSASWQELMARGDFATILGEAEARGIETCLTSASADDLRALADAARYRGRTALAERGLRALRKRFGASSGRDAAFLLGRLAEQGGDLAGAETWYRTYLREAPSDAFAAEALAGTMRAVRSLRGVAAARPLAEDYLQRFPKGVHAATARTLLGLE